HPISSPASTYRISGSFLDWKMLVEVNPEAALAVYEAAVKEFGDTQVRFDQYKPRGAAAPDFPVRSSDNSVVSSLVMSEVLRMIPAATTEYVFVAPEIREDAKRWRDIHKDEIINPEKENS
ncbi:MAG: hypothetical protein O2968_16210, partial [Acidobacteria bacterium]|nr:hypothetical protein [Acidobacteriota bacterium]